MLFNSIIFILVFLPVFLMGWYYIRNINYRLAWLTGFSFLFYAYWDWRFLFLMLASIAVDFYCGKKIAGSVAVSKKKAKKWMIVSISFNLLILGFFKYFNFFIDTVYDLLPADSLISKPALNIILPAGISFYSFSSMSYAIDLYLGKARPVLSFLHFSAYISMFPHLVAGPIVRYRFIDEQLKKLHHTPEYDAIYKGLFIFCIGLFRKIFIADFFALEADNFFNTHEYYQHRFIESWVGVLSYAFQIYYDFSAYSEMAVGLGLLIGIQFPYNFNSPYKARSFSDFWRRWHITLSEFLRDYLYIPLGGNRRGISRTYFNLMITMLIGGLWHGASWMFVIWGALHGAFLVIEKLFSRFKLEDKKFYRVLVFIGVCMAWIFFRSPNLHIAVETVKACLLLNGVESFQPAYEVFGVGIPQFVRATGGLLSFLAPFLGILMVTLLPNVYEINYPKTKWATFVLALLLFICIINIYKPSPYLYFKF